MEKETQQKIQQLSVYEQNLQQIMMQKQQLLGQLVEYENAEKELEKVEEAYKIIGNVMIKAKKEELQKEIKNKKEIVDLKVKKMEQQEKSIKENKEKLQKEVMGKM